MSERRKLQIEWKCPDCGAVCCEHVNGALTAARVECQSNAAELTTLRERLARVEAERDRYVERERHFAAALCVADGGRYRADWDGAISSVLKRMTAAEAEAERMRKRLGALTNAAGVLLALPVGNRYEEEALAQLKREWTLSDAALSSSPQGPGANPNPQHKEE